MDNHRSGPVCNHSAFARGVLTSCINRIVKRLRSGIQPAARPTLPEELIMPDSIEVTKESTFVMKKNVWRAVIEVGFIIFLFYSNLLMGEFERSGMGQKRGIAWAIGDVLTAANFAIAMIAALIGYVLFEFLRKRF